MFPRVHIQSHITFALFITRTNIHNKEYITKSVMVSNIFPFPDRIKLLVSLIQRYFKCTRHATDMRNTLIALETYAIEWAIWLNLACSLLMTDSFNSHQTVMSTWLNCCSVYSRVFESLTTNLALSQGITSCQPFIASSFHFIILPSHVCRLLYNGKRHMRCALQCRKRPHSSQTEIILRSVKTFTGVFSKW